MGRCGPQSPRADSQFRLLPKRRPPMESGAALIAVLAMAMSGCRSPESIDRRSDDRAVDPVLEVVSAHQPILIDPPNVGCLTVGVELDSIRRACEVVSESVVDVEGFPQRSIGVMAGTDTVFAEMSGDRVWRVWVDSPNIMTHDSLHVGIPVSRLASYPDIRVGYGHTGASIVVGSHCGIVFASNDLPFRRSPWTPDDLLVLSDSIRVDGILVLAACGT